VTVTEQIREESEADDIVGWQQIECRRF